MYLCIAQLINTLMNETWDWLNQCLFICLCAYMSMYFNGRKRPTLNLFFVKYLNIWNLIHVHVFMCATLLVSKVLSIWSSSAWHVPLCPKVMHTNDLKSGRWWKEGKQNDNYKPISPKSHAPKTTIQILKRVWKQRRFIMTSVFFWQLLLLFSIFKKGIFFPIVNLNNSAVFVGGNSTNFQYQKIGKEKIKKEKPLNMTEGDNY